MHAFEDVIDRQVVPARERTPGVLNGGGAVDQHTVVVEQQTGDSDRLGGTHTTPRFT